MNISFKNATKDHVEEIYCLCKKLVDDYENTAEINYEKVLKWIHRKIENSIHEYTVIYSDNQKVGYFHFYKNQDDKYEIDDLYILPQFQNKGIGTEVIKMCCSSVSAPVMLYVFVKNKKAVALYKRLGFKVKEIVNNTRYIMEKQ